MTKVSVSGEQCTTFVICTYIIHCIGITIHSCNYESAQELPGSMAAGTHTIYTHNTLIIHIVVMLMLTVAKLMLLRVLCL